MPNASLPTRKDWRDVWFMLNNEEKITNEKETKSVSSDEVEAADMVTIGTGENDATEENAGVLIEKSNENERNDENGKDGGKLPFLKNKRLRSKVKLVVILSAEFIAIIVILALIFFAGKKSHTVTFDLNGGILISGDTVQRVTQGQNATPPTVAKFGHYLLGWTGSYRSITRDVVLKAIWEFETSPGIEYYIPENTNYCEISGSHKYIQGEVYIGAYHNERKVLGIQSGAFKGREGITAVYLLDGILSIDSEAFADCTSLEIVDIPSTVVEIGEGAFKNCTALKEVNLPEALRRIDKDAFAGCTSLEKVTCGDKLVYIGEGAFSGCTMLNEVDLGESVERIDFRAFSACEALKEVVIPKSLVSIESSAFNTSEMTFYFCFGEDEMPLGYLQHWCPDDATFIFDYVPPTDDEEGEEGEDDKGEDENDDESAYLGTGKQRSDAL